MQRLLRGTDWIDSYASRLIELEGAEKQNQSFYFSSGIRTSAVKVPLHYFAATNSQEKLNLQPPKQEEPPYQPNYDEHEEIPFND